MVTSSPLLLPDMTQNSAPPTPAPTVKPKTQRKKAVKTKSTILNVPTSPVRIPIAAPAQTQPVTEPQPTKNLAFFVSDPWFHTKTEAARKYLATLRLRPRESYTASLPGSHRAVFLSVGILIVVIIGFLIMIVQFANP